jgi:hypothetical protein
MDDAQNAIRVARLATGVKKPTVPAEDATIEGELWAGDQANTKHEERAVRELYRRRLRIAELEGIARSQHAMLDEIARAAGFGELDTYSAPSIIARLRGQK